MTAMNGVHLYAKSNVELMSFDFGFNLMLKKDSFCSVPPYSSTCS